MFFLIYFYFYFLNRHMSDTDLKEKTKNLTKVFFPFFSSLLWLCCGYVHVFVFLFLCSCLWYNNVVFFNF